jgi:hypothetical protein
MTDMPNFRFLENGRRECIPSNVRPGLSIDLGTFGESLLISNLVREVAG